MGGVNAVRAYPRGEGSGSKGFVSSLQLNYLIRQSLILSPFIDYGQVENKSQLNSKYDLSGAGLAVSFLVLIRVFLILLTQEGLVKTLID